MKHIVKRSWGALTRSCGTALRAGALVLGGALLAGQAAHANFVNGGFNTDLTGWTVTPYSNRGIQTFPPTQKSHLNLQSPNPTNTLTMVTSGSDANTNNALVVPRTGAGARSARVNGPWPASGAGTPDYRTSSLQQTITATAADFVGGDGNMHVRMMLAPVLQNPNHGNADQPYFFVQLTNLSKGNAVLFTQFNFANQPGVNWQTYGTGNNVVQFTDWVTIDVPLPPGQVDAGDNISLEIIAAGCSQSGHWGYVYVDEATTGPLPGLAVTASGPSGIVLNTNSGQPYSTITYTYTYTNNSAVATNASTVNVVLPQTTTSGGTVLNTTFNSYNAGATTCTTPAVGAAGTVSCNFGTLAPGATGSFTVTVNVPYTASTVSPSNVVNHGNYNISATNVPPLTGPLVVTKLYAAGVVLDVTKTGAGTGTVSSSPTGIICGAGCTTANMTVAPNTPVTLTAAAAVGSTFTGWSGGGCSGAAATCTVPMSASTSVTANFVPVTYPLTVSTTGSGAITSNPGSISCPGANCNETFNHGTLVTLTATPQSGNALTGWTGCASNPTPTTCEVTMDQAHTVTASFVPTFPLTVSTTGPGSVTSNVGGVNCGATCGATFNNGTVVTLTANTPPNSVFTGWGGACSGTASTCTVTMDQVRNVTASFVPTYVVTPSVAGGTGGTITPNVPSTVNSGTQVVYTLSPTPGYRAQVTGTCGGVLSGNTFTTSAVTADCTVVVTFAVIPANPVPTLSQWAMMLMAALLAWLAVSQTPLRNRRL